MVFTFLKVDFETLKLPTLKVIFVHEEQQSDFSLPVKGSEYESSWSPYHQGIAVKKYNYICMYNNISTTCLGHFITGHHQVGYNVRGTIYLL